MCNYGITLNKMEALLAYLEGSGYIDSFLTMAILVIKRGLHKHLGDGSV